MKTMILTLLLIAGCSKPCNSIDVYRACVGIGGEPVVCAHYGINKCRK